MMKFKSLFRRKASGSASPSPDALSPTLSQSSSASSLIVSPAVSPVEEVPQSPIAHQRAASAEPCLSRGPCLPGPQSGTKSQNSRASGLHKHGGSASQDSPLFELSKSMPELEERFEEHDLEETDAAGPSNLTTRLSGDSQYFTPMVKDVRSATFTFGEERESSPPMSIRANIIPTVSVQSDGSNTPKISVACLQGRIQEMEETHHSTNEELQATLQELTDLQSQLSEVQTENEKLQEEKSALEESLRRQAEQLKEARFQTEALQQVLAQYPEARRETGDRERHLLDLLAESEEERKSMLAQITQLQKLLTATQEESSEKDTRIAWLQNRVRHLEDEAAVAEALAKQGQDEEDKKRLMLAKELESLKQDKEAYLAQLNSTQETLSQVQREVNTYKEQALSAQDETKVLKQKASAEKADLEYKLEQLLAKKQTLVVETGALHAAVAELEQACRRHLEDKREMRTVAEQQDSKMQELVTRQEEAERTLAEERAKWEMQVDEWQQFQKDLLTTVRVANEFKMEAAQEVEKVTAENQNLKEQLNALQAELNQSKTDAVFQPETPVLPTPSSTARRVLRTMSNQAVGDVVIRPKTLATRTDNPRLSVKSLVENIEVCAKQKDDILSPTTPHSVPVATVRPSTSSVSDASSAVDLARQAEGRKGDLHRTSSDTFCLRSSRSGMGTYLGELQHRNSYADGLVALNKDNISPIKNPPVRVSLEKSVETFRKSNQSENGKDALANLTKNGGSKRNALLKWCQQRTAGYRGIDITNFSSSWNDGLALCALFHTFLPDAIPFSSLNAHDTRRNFSLAFKAAESVGIPTILDINDMVSKERPDWQCVMSYITSIYKHFEG